MGGAVTTIFEGVELFSLHRMDTPNKVINHELVPVCLNIIWLSDDFQTFRIGLFGLDKLHDIDGTVARLREALQQVL